MISKIFLLVFSLIVIISCANRKATEQKTERVKSDYIIQDNVLIETRDGATISAMVVQKKGISKPKSYICNASFGFSQKVHL